MIQSTYSGLEAGNLLIGKSIRLGNDGNQVNLGMQTTHDFNIQGLQRMAGGLNEEHTGVDTIIHNIHAVYLVLGIQISIVTLLDVVDNGSPRLVVIDKVTKSRGCQRQSGADGHQLPRCRR